ncbi:MAG: hypothetical protein IT463_06625, partial [Planctomycetes bacterium]|nr:hypothetical protein [Planctomycetota bacterium]
MQSTLRLLLSVVLLVAAGAAFAQSATISAPAGQTAVSGGDTVTVAGSGWAASASVDSGFFSTYEYLDNGTVQVGQVMINTAGLSVDGSGNLSGTFTLSTPPSNATRVRIHVSVNGAAQSADSNFLTLAPKPELIGANVNGNILRLQFDQLMADPSGSATGATFSVSQATGATTPNLSGVAVGDVTLDGGDNHYLLVDMSGATQKLVQNNQISISGMLVSAAGASADTTIAAVSCTQTPGVASCSYNANTKVLTITFDLAVTVASVNANKSALAVDVDAGGSPVALTNATLTTVSNGATMSFTLDRAADAAINALATRNLVYTPGTILDTLSNAVAGSSGTDVPVSYTTDSTAPAIVDIRQQAADASTVLVTFDEYLDQATAENTSNYSCSGGQTLNTATLQSNGISVLLDFNTNVTAGSQTLSASNVEDTSGNAMASVSGQTIYTQFDSDGTITAGPLSEPATISSVAAAAAAVSVFDFRIVDNGSTDGQPTNVTQVVVDLTGSTADAADGTWTLWGPDASGAAGTVSGSVGSQTVTFASLSIQVSDSSVEAYTVKLQMQAAPTPTADNDNFSFSVDRSNITCDPAGSQMTAGAGTAVTSSTTYTVTATKLTVSTGPGSSETANSAFAVAVAFTDANGNTDTDVSGDTVTAARSDAGTINSGGTSGAAVSGVATFSINLGTPAATSIYLTLTDGSGGIDLSASPVNTSTFDLDAVAEVSYTENTSAASITGTGGAQDVWSVDLADAGADSLSARVDAVVFHVAVSGGTYDATDFTWSLYNGSSSFAQTSSTATTVTFSAGSLLT